MDPQRQLASWSALALGALLLSVVLASGAGARPTTHEPADAARVRAASRANRPLDTAILDPASLGGRESEVAYEHARRTGARFLRILMRWADVAPKGERPSVFSARDPGDPRYRWAAIDAQVRMAVAMGFTPIVYVQTAPAWAQGCSKGPGACRPSPGDLADFMTAVARRYRGGHQGLPRVRYWQIWNEPNFDLYLTPQADDVGRPVSPEIYRALVNAAYRAIHAVHADNVVIAGGTMPFGRADSNDNTVSPLRFMRQLLCLSDGPRPLPECRRHVRFDVWAHHPYTEGDPTHHASLSDNVSVPELWKMRVLLEAAEKGGTLRSRGRVRFWVTEFGWDTNPPDPNGVPERLHARWVAEAMYRMWDQGVSLVTWFLLRDQVDSPFQSGLYLRGSAGVESDRPKLALRAFRFPFVAFRQPKTGFVRFWGRSPHEGAAVIVEQRATNWRVVTRTRSNKYGIFFGRFRSTADSGSVRARLVGGKESSLPFSLVVPPDRPGCVWGTC